MVRASTPSLPAGSLLIARIGLHVEDVAIGREMIQTGRGNNPRISVRSYHTADVRILEDCRYRCRTASSASYRIGSNASATAFWDF